MRKPDSERLERFTAGLEKAGYKVTGQRAAVCAALASAAGHPTVQEIFELAKERAGSISLATVYNTMTTLKQLGLVSELSAPNDPCTHFELDNRPHVNLMCERCHHVFDAHLPMLHGIEAEAEEYTGFKVADTHLVLIGICRNCQQQ